MDLRGLKLSALRHSIGVVFQEALLLNRSIAENLQVAKPDATPDEMREALARAQALDFVDANPEGLEAKVGERGRRLSGGERQRLSIARALLKNPPILILDEATSALDAATEVKIQAALDEVMKSRTTFVIAHRLSTIRRADQIMVMEQGRILERGTHAQLYAARGRYYDLYTRQHGVEVNLFLAPGEGDAVAVPGDAAEIKNGDVKAADALRVLRGEMR
jgi:ATP-binding cassette, subfamily B, beta-glucan exporter